jgi:branched-chain amino acid transport system ATP-binding protein
VLAGLRRPAGGSVQLAGEEVAGAAPERIARLGLAYVPAGRRVFRSLTVAENLALGAYRERSLAATRREAVYARFPRLAARPGQLAGTLSGGEQQLLAIARGLMAAPRLLVLDEASAGLAPPAVAAVAGALEAIRREGTAVLLADVGLALAGRLADRVILLEDGRVALSAPRAEALADPRLGIGYVA